MYGGEARVNFFPRPRRHPRGRCPQLCDASVPSALFSYLGDGWRLVPGRLGPARAVRNQKKYRPHFLGVSQVSPPPCVAQCWFPPVSWTESQRNVSSLRRGRALLSAESCGDAARGRNAGTGFSAVFSPLMGWRFFVPGAPAPSPQSFPHGLSFLCGQVWWSWAVFCAGVGGARFIGATPAAKKLLCASPK